MFLEWLRRVAFWSLDALRGSPIRTEYQDIKNIMDNDDRSKIPTYLDDLLDHATATTPFYFQYRGKTFEQFPVINKSKIKENYESFLSESFKGKPHHCMSTSGSTGTPFCVIQDMRKRHRVLAELIYFNECVGQKVGQKFVFFRVWTESLRVSKLALWAKNEIALDISNLDDENMGHIRQLLRSDRSIHEIMGYASTHKCLLKYIENCGDSSNDYHVKLILSGSEMMEIPVREGLRKQFGCAVVSRYSNQENGVLAQQCAESEEYHINSASYYIELLKLDSDEPATIGEPGRVVVTDLFNYAMPLIRYDTGDIATEKTHSDCGWNTRLLQQIEGRRVNCCYAPDGKMLSPHLFGTAMEPFTELAQFQFIQNGKNDYVLKINDPKNTYVDSDFYPVLREYLGENACVAIERVSEIPCCASGKFMQAICNYHPE